MTIPLSNLGEQSIKRVFNTWWPLAASWMLMGVELPALSAVVARLENPEINLAAYGGVVFPLALIVESPIIMLLAASTALSKDWASYARVRRFMIAAAVSLTALHILVAFTPLYYVVVEGIIGAPTEIVGPARIGLMIMTPWTAAIAYRRFNQGVLIRFNHAKRVGLGTVVRLSSNVLMLTLGYFSGRFPGIVVATSAVAMGVTCEAIYVGFVVHPVLNRELKNAPKVEPPLTWREFWAFYIPLAMTSLITLLANPIGSAALSRMPEALSSLAVWPVVMGLIFLLRSTGIAYNEVVVALLDEPGTYPNLWKFTGLLAAFTSLALFLIVSTPLSTLWLVDFSALPAHLVELARLGLWLTIPIPALTVIQSWYQGAIMHGRRTRGITEAVVVYLITSAILLGAGVVWGQTTGLYVGLATLTISVAVQTAWLWYRSRPVLRSLQGTD